MRLIAIVSVVVVLAATAHGAPAGSSAAKKEIWGNLYGKWEECTFAFVGRLSPSVDSAPAIAAAAFAACQQHEDAMFHFSADNNDPRVHEFVVDQLLPAAKQTLRDKLMAVWLAKRTPPQRPARPAPAKKGQEI